MPLQQHRYQHLNFLLRHKHQRWLVVHRRLNNPSLAKYHQDRFLDQILFFFLVINDMPLYFEDVQCIFTQTTLWLIIPNKDQFRFKNVLRNELNSSQKRMRRKRLNMKLFKIRVHDIRSKRMLLQQNKKGKEEMKGKTFKRMYRYKAQSLYFILI